MLPNPTIPKHQVISLFSVLLWICLFLLGIWLAVQLRALIPPFLVSLIAAMTLTPLVDQLEERGYRRGLAIAIIYFLFLCGMCLILKGIYAVATGDVQNILQSIPFPVIQLPTPHPMNPSDPKDIASYLNHLHWMHHIPAFLSEPLVQEAQRLPGLVGPVLTELPIMAGNVAWVLLVPIITFFLLLDFDKILGKLLILVPDAKREGLLTAVTGIIAVFGNYIRGVLSVMMLDIVVIYFVMVGFGMGRYASVLSIFAGVLYTIPYFGALVSTIIIGLVAYATHGLVTALIVTAVMIFIHQFLFDNIIAPRVIGGSVNMHPLLTLAALLAGGTLFGIGGTLLAVPLAAAAQVVLVQIYPQLKLDVVSLRRTSGTRKASEEVVENAIAEEQQDDDDDPQPDTPPKPKTTRSSAPKTKAAG